MNVNRIALGDGQRARTRWRASPSALTPRHSAGGTESARSCRLLSIKFPRVLFSRARASRFLDSPFDFSTAVGFCASGNSQMIAKLGRAATWSVNVPSHPLTPLRQWDGNMRGLQPSFLAVSPGAAARSRPRPAACDGLTRSRANLYAAKFIWYPG